MAVESIVPRSEQDAIDRARALIPYLREHGARISAAGSIPDDIFARLSDSGLLGLMRPRRYGGPEMGPDLVLRVATALAEGDGSTAWVYVVLGSHNHLVGLYPEAVQAEIWASRQPSCASSYVPTGKAVLVDGGYRVSGKWSFCSGIDHCDWTIVGAVAGGEDGREPPSLHIFLLPKAELELADDWHVMGLAGTGSKSIFVRDKFVPHHRVLRNIDIMSGQTPGAALHTNPLYHNSIWPLFGFSILAPATGIVRGAYETMVREAAERLRAGDPMFESRRVAILMRFAEVSANLEAAELLYERGITDTCDKIMRGAALSHELRVRNRRDQAFIGILCRRAMDTLMGAAGGRGIREENSVQRGLRDVYAISAHPASSWDSASLNFGSVATGGPVTELFC